MLVRSAFDNEVCLNFSTVRIALARHPEMAKMKWLDQEVVTAVSEPDFVLAGKYGENIAVKRIAAGYFSGRWLLVPYREGGDVSTVSAASQIEKMVGGRLILLKR